MNRNGRPRKNITIEDLACEPDETMSILISMKNGGASWRLIAEMISTEHTEISHGLARKTALGLCRSPKIEMALGLREELVTVPISRVKRTYKRRNETKRTRLNIDCPPASKHRYDNQRGAMSRADYLEHLLDLDSGIGELEI